MKQLKRLDDYLHYFQERMFFENEFDIGFETGFMKAIELLEKKHDLKLLPDEFRE